MNFSQLSLEQLKELVRDDLPHGFRPRVAKAESSGVQPLFKVEGPWDYGDPVHESITVKALRDAAVVNHEAQFTDPAVWEFLRGVLWNDDPEGLFFDNNLNETNNWSGGFVFAIRFKSYKNQAVAGTFFGPSSPLLARSHFGDLQCLHAMGSKNDERAEDTHAAVLGWAEFLYLVAVGTIQEDMHLGKIKTSRMDYWFPNSTQTARNLFLIDAKGSVVHRAIGALMHIVQDSYARGHVERNAKGEIVEFHSYIHQDDDKHGKEDEMERDGLQAMPGAMRAVDCCVQVLRHWKKNDEWAVVKSYLKETVFKLAADVRPAGPGDQFRK